MKIPKLSSNINYKTFNKSLRSSLLALPLLLPAGLSIYGMTLEKDEFIKKEQAIIPMDTVTPKGVFANKLSNVPSPVIKIGNDELNAVIVVDLSVNTLYTYDELGRPLKAYKVATGKYSTPTKTGIRKIIGIENYPYKYAPKNSKRRRNPNAYGPKIILLSNVNEKTGELTYSNGQFIHGNNNPESIGKKASKGCIRMDNEVIKDIAKLVSSGQYVLIKE